MGIKRHSKAARETVVEFVRRCASGTPEIQRVLMFGSRARGDAKERSDFDFAVEAPTLSHSKWSRFALEIEENVPTLCGIDLIRLDEKITQTLREKIEREGVVLYERAA